MRLRIFLFCAAIVGITAPAPGAWREAVSAHFIVYSEEKPDAVREFATELERFDAAMRVLRGLQPTTDSTTNKLTVFQLSNIQAVQKIMGADSRYVAGFYNGDAGNSVAFVPRSAGSADANDLQAQTVLLHEYAHHFMYRNYPGAFPRWFSEGYAEFNSTARFGKDGSVDLGLPAYHRAAGLQYLRKLPIAELMSADTAELSSDATEALYGRGWLLTHYLSFSKDRQGQLAAYLTAINKGAKPLDAARETFGDLAKLDRELDRYMQARMTYLRVPAAKVTFAPIEVRELSPGASAMLPVMVRSRRGVNNETAKAVLADARRVAAPYPDDPFVQLALAEAELDAGNPAEADKAADRVLAKQPDNVRALVFKGRIAMDRLGDSKAPTEEDWKAVRRWFVRANRAEPGAPVPLVLFYQSFAAEGLKPTPNAVEGLRTAALLAPEDVGLRLSLAHQYLEDDKGPEARAALAPVAYSPHGGPLAEFAARVIAAIDANGAKAGLAAWNETPKEDERKDDGAARSPTRSD